MEEINGARGLWRGVLIVNVKRWAFVIFFLGCGELFEALYPFLLLLGKMQDQVEMGQNRNLGIVLYVH